MLTKEYSPMEHGIVAFNENELLGKGEVYKIYMELATLVHEPKCNPAVQLRRWKKLGPKLLRYLEVVDKINNGYTKIYDKENKREKENLRKKWREDEDEMLIELASSGSMSISELARAMGRTPAAVSSRLSILVGIGRVSQEIAGKFIGRINGEQVSGDISGVLERRRN